MDEKIKGWSRSNSTLKGARLFIKTSTEALTYIFIPNFF